jgi:hypothetical protein
VLPWVEALSGLSLVLGAWKRTSAQIVGILLLLFIGAISINLARGNPVNCGCFDIKAKDKPRAELLAEMKWTILRDAGMLVMVAQVLSAARADRRR